MIVFAFEKLAATFSNVVQVILTATLQIEKIYFMQHFKNFYKGQANLYLPDIGSSNFVG